VAQLLARRDPRRIAALVLIATGARLPIADEFFEMLEARPEALGQWLARVAYSPATGRRLARSDARHWVAQSPRSSWLADLEACRTFDLRGELGGLECRTTVIGGADDRLTSPGMLEALASEIPRAQLHLLSRAGHQLIGERPDRVAELVAEAVR
jgi:pimeloyl-ACP methyl ester carboxylesterase